MRIGISMASSYNVQNPRIGAQYMIERAKAAADAKLHSLFVGDHHVTPIPYYQNTPILARALAHWRAAPAGALYLLPLRHPVLLAEEIGTLAAIAPDRFILQAGLGRADQQYDAMGVNRQHRPSRFEECLDIMRRLWRGEVVNHQGRWQIEQAKISPVPDQPVEVWVAAHARAAIERAARIGDGWLASPDLAPDRAKERLAIYSEACDQYQRPVGVKALRRDIFIGATQQQAEKIVAPIIGQGYRGFPPDALIFGDIESVKECFYQLEEIGYTDIIIRHLVNDQQMVLESLERLGKLIDSLA